MKLEAPGRSCFCTCAWNFKQRGPSFSEMFFLLSFRAFTELLLERTHWFHVTALAQICSRHLAKYCTVMKSDRSIYCISAQSPCQCYDFRLNPHQKCCLQLLIALVDYSSLLHIAFEFASSVFVVFARKICNILHCTPFFTC